MKTTNDKSTSVSFTGYRIKKILLGQVSLKIIDDIKSELRSTIIKLHGEGYISYYNGMSEGFDLISAEMVLELQDEGYDIKLIAVVPFIGQNEWYGDRSKMIYPSLLERAAEVIFTSYDYHDRCFHKRNDYLIANCSKVVCYYSGQKGGTMYTVNRAIKAGLPIINIFDTLTTKGLIDTTPLQNTVSCWESIKAACAKIILP